MSILFYMSAYCLYCFCHCKSVKSEKLESIGENPCQIRTLLVATASIRRVTGNTHGRAIQSWGDYREEGLLGSCMQLRLHTHLSDSPKEALVTSCNQRPRPRTAYSLLHIWLQRFQLRKMQRTDRDVEAKYIQTCSVIDFSLHCVISPFLVAVAFCVESAQNCESKVVPHSAIAHAQDGAQALAAQRWSSACAHSGGPRP